MYLLSSNFSFEQSDALFYITTLSSLFIICRVIGAFMGDLVIGNRNAVIIGSLLQALGAFMLIFPSQWSLYIGIAFIALGSGTCNINLSAIFAKLYLGKTKLLDAAFTMYYTTIHIGAFIGILIIGALGAYSFKLGFALAGIIALISTLLFLVIKIQTSSERNLSRFQSYPNRLQYLIAVVALVNLFWLIYEFAGKNFPAFQTKFTENILFSTNNESWFSAYNDSLVLVVGLILSIVWSFNYTTQYLKVSLGFLLTAIAFFCIMNSPENSLANSSDLFVILSLTTFSLGEIFIAPAIGSALTKYSNPKYLAISFSLAKLPTLFLPFLCALIPQSIQKNDFLSLKIIIISLSIFGIMSFFLFNKFGMKKMKNTLQED